MAQPSTSNRLEDSVRRYKAHNEKMGWEAVPLMAAFAFGKPVRFHINCGRSSTGRSTRVYEGTFCRTCCATPNPYTAVMGYISSRMTAEKSSDPSRFLVVLIGPDHVPPSSKKTHCVLCDKPAFPELIKERPNR